jgi:hypothetical protein
MLTKTEIRAKAIPGKAIPREAKDQAIGKALKKVVLEKMLQQYLIKKSALIPKAF